MVSLINSLGFLDREPVSAERAAVGCHIAFIGDSYTEAREVSIADKFHVRLEEMAARELPHLDITTQAYGITGTGQINQLPFYDEYARRLSPKLVALVFYSNDFRDNSIALQSVHFGMDPDRMRHMTAQKDTNGTLKLRPPAPEFQRFLLPRLPNAWYESAWGQLVRISYFAKWLDTKVDLGGDKHMSQLAAWVDMIAERPCCALLLDGYSPEIRRIFSKEHLPPVYQEALEYTSFGIDQFKRRADRDGAKLAILFAPEEMGLRGDL